MSYQQIAAVSDVAESWTHILFGGEIRLSSLVAAFNTNSNIYNIFVGLNNDDVLIYDSGALEEISVINATDMADQIIVVDTVNNSNGYYKAAYDTDVQPSNRQVNADLDTDAMLLAGTDTDMPELSISDTYKLTAQSAGDQAPRNLQLQFSPKTATNVPVNLSGSFIDPDLVDRHTVTIQWGDGTANSVVNLSSGNTTINSLHVYQSPGNYTISVTVADDIGQVQSSRSIQVGNSSFSDFNRDNLSDIVWRNRVTGQNSLWLLGVNNQQISGEAIQSVPDPAWSIEGIGDYDGDGQDDLVWRNGTTGQNNVWLMDGTQRVGSIGLDTVTGSDWQIQGVGSFQTNSIMSSDLVWRNQKTGQNVIWRMNGTNRAGSVRLDSVTNPAWEIVGAGDFDGDGQNNDLVWRNYDNGRNTIWFVNPDGTKSTQSLGKLANTQWRIEGVSDFDRDGQKNDLLWRNEVTGETLVWFIGSDFLQQGAQDILPQVANPNWSVVV